MNWKIGNGQEEQKERLRINMREKTFNQIKDFIITVIFCLAFLYMGFGVGFLYGTFNVWGTVLNPYEMNITVNNMNCSQKILFTNSYLTSLYESITYILSGFIFILFGAIIEASFKYKRKRK